jgi:Domain of unknown function (DUF397)
VSQRHFADARWIKNSRSTTQNSCVELARAATTVGVRDSKNGDAGPILELAPTGFIAFITAAKAGNLDA